jgi:hypothetical protein
MSIKQRLDNWLANRTATASDAARILSEEARVQKARRDQTTARLRACVDSGRIAYMEWK